MLAHAGPIGATTGHGDFSRLGEKTSVALREALHDALIEAALEQIDQRSDRLAAVTLDFFPKRLGERFNLNVDPIDLRTADDRADIAALDLQVDYRAVGHISSAAGEATAEVAVRAQDFRTMRFPKMNWRSCVLRS